ncbi:MAG: hypothetical protein FalmKO_07460 [Falsiruegeria mediterranea]
MTPDGSFRLSDPSQLRDLTNWDVELTQIERGNLNARVSVWAGQKLTLIDLNFDKAVHQTGTSRPDVLAFGLPDPQRISKWLGQVPSDTDVMTFGSDQPFDGVSSQIFSGVVFGIDTQFAQGMADHCGLDISEALKGAATSSMSNVGAHHFRIRQMARLRIARGLNMCSPEEEDDLILSILEMLSSPRVWCDSGKSSQRNRAARMAVEYMISNLDECISIRQICTEVGVSAPTLRRGFLDAYGIGPKQFLQRSRLSAVHAKLARQRHDCGIADVANSYGFWHMGQFARDYRAFFGELPSQTLAETGIS